jgi:hypothetical protein
MRKLLDFHPQKHGWHFANDLSTDAGIRTYGLCGGMCLSALNYYRHNIPIPKLKFEDVADSHKITVNGRKLINVPLVNPGAPHPVFSFIFHSQMASYQTSNMAKQFVIFWDDHDENHYKWSIKDEFPHIKKSIDKGCFVMLGLRNPNKGDLMGHQCLVYGYDDNASRLYMYDPNFPDKECIAIDGGNKIEFYVLNTDGSKYSYGYNYRSYYFLMELEPNRTSQFENYDFFRNKSDNFAVKPSYVDPVMVNKAGDFSASIRNGVIATPANTNRR